MAFTPASADVSGGQLATATQYNTLRADAINDTGNIHPQYIATYNNSFISCFMTQDGPAVERTVGMDSGTVPEATIDIIAGNSTVFTTIGKIFFVRGIENNMSITSNIVSTTFAGSYPITDVKYTVQVGRVTSANVFVPMVDSSEVNAAAFGTAEAGPSLTDIDITDASVGDIIQARFLLRWDSAIDGSDEVQGKFFNCYIDRTS